MASLSNWLKKPPALSVQEQLAKLLLSSGDTLVLTRTLYEELGTALLERDRTRAQLMLCVQLLQDHGIDVPSEITESPF